MFACLTGSVAGLLQAREICEGLGQEQLSAGEPQAIARLARKRK
jgi:hypothetical protein